VVNVCVNNFWTISIHKYDQTESRRKIYNIIRWSQAISKIKLIRTIYGPLHRVFQRLRQNNQAPSTIPIKLPWGSTLTLCKPHVE